MEKKLKISIQNRGITLVALVITIVILIILAVVAINAVFGDDGLLKYAQDAKNYQANADVSDAEMINDATSYIDEIIGGDSGGTEENPSETTVTDAKDSGEIFTQTTEIKDDSGDSVWVPGGFGIAGDSATDADNGVVIQDEKGNQFVWIPVPDYTTMYTEVPGIKLSGESSGVTTTTDVYSKLRLREYEIGYTPSTPGSTEADYIKEPDLAIGYDIDEQYYKDILGYNSPKDMADALVAEYTETYNSIKKYKGFYVGRYELTGSIAEPTVQKGKAVVEGQNWYNLKKACSNVVSSEYAQSEMIYGNQWDEIMSWLKVTVFKDDPDKVDIDSSSWGNCPYSTGDAAINSGIQQPAGTNEAWKANNVYDLSGNYWEATQEAGGDAEYSYRIIRGTDINAYEVNYSVSSRVDFIPNENGTISSRPTLYIK